MMGILINCDSLSARYFMYIYYIVAFRPVFDAELSEWSNETGLGPVAFVATQVRILYSAVFSFCCDFLLGMASFLRFTVFVLLF